MKTNCVFYEVDNKIFIWHLDNIILKIIKLLLQYYISGFMQVFS